MMVLPVAAAQMVARSFKGALAISIAIGIGASIAGLGVSRVAGSAPSGTIVLVAAGVFVVVSIASRSAHRIRGTVEADV